MSISFIYALIPAVIIAVIALIAVSIVAEHKQGGNGSGMKAAYFFSMSAVALGFIIGASIFLVYQGFAHWVFPDAAETAIQREGPPPSPFFESAIKPDSSMTTEALTCADGCEMTNAQKTEITGWVDQYDTWVSRVANNTQLKRELVNAFSFLIVAVPVFFIHYSYIRRTRDREGIKQIRSTYYYGVSIISMILVLISVGFLLNSMLNSWIAPEKDALVRNYPESISEDTSIATVTNCAEKCDLGENVTTTVASWQEDNVRWQEADNNGVSQRQELAASMLAALIVSIPVFWYHFGTARKETKG